jgi:dTDP-4-dehydrorhamnose reductase
MNKILLTGSTGRLGTELKKHLNMLTPTIDELNVLVRENIYEYCVNHIPSLIVHAAAYTDVAKAQTDRDNCWNVNVAGTRNILDVADTLKIPVLYISTDYVYEGTVGNYKESDLPFPVPGNFYAFSKFVGELMTLMNSKNKVIRTSFKESKWKYPTAFTDVYTSADYVDIIAKDISLAISNFKILPNVTNIATERKSVYDLAKRRNPEVKPSSRKDISTPIPSDISMDVSLWNMMKGKNAQSK